MTEISQDKRGRDDNDDFENALPSAKRGSLEESEETEEVSAHSEAPLFKFGLCSDPQHSSHDDVEIDDEYYRTEKFTRRFRASLEIFRAANEEFNTQNCTCSILLGDIIDSRSMPDKCNSVVEDFNAVHEIISSSNNPWHVTIGNNDVKTMTRETLFEKLIPDEFKLQCSPEKMYYSFVPHPGFRMIILDNFDISNLMNAAERSASTESNTIQAIEILERMGKEIEAYTTAHNNCGYEDIPESLFKYQPWNGAIGREQAEWLDETLRESSLAEELCFVFGHTQIDSGSGRIDGLLWNNDEIVSILHKYNNVCAYIHGHDHIGGFTRDSSGLFHICPPAPLECEPGQVAYGYISCYDTNFKLTWFGKEPTVRRPSPSTSSPDILPWPTTMPYPTGSSRSTVENESGLEPQPTSDDV